MVLRSGMCFLKQIKMTEKLNLHKKTPRFYYHKASPFYFLSNFSIGAQNFESVEKTQKFIQKIFFFLRIVKCHFLFHKSSSGFQKI